MKLPRPSIPPPVRGPFARPQGGPATPSSHRPAERPARRLIPRPRSGFTLIELLLVLAILGILAAIVVPKFSGRTEQARITAAQSQIATFGTALDAFEVDNGFYPKGKDGLLDLVQQPRDSRNWKGPYMKSDIPNDPWGRPYIYESPGRQNPNAYDLLSMGPDGREGTEDDITNFQRAR